MDNSELAERLLDVIPPLMHQIRLQMRTAAREKLTVPQYRLMAAIQRGICHVGEIAEYHGVSQPAMSKMVQTLVERGLIRRTPSGSDRRQYLLASTRKGQTLFNSVQKIAQAGLNQQLLSLSKDQSQRLLRALSNLEDLAKGDRK